MPLLSVLLGAVVVVLFTVALFFIAAFLPAVPETLVAVVLPFETAGVLATRLLDVPEVLRLILFADALPRIGTLLVNTLSELLW